MYPVFISLFFLIPKIAFIASKKALFGHKNHDFFPSHPFHGIFRRENPFSRANKVGEIAASP